ncbi:MAG: hypothetical protein KatS3mg032_0409 [Cyclobacteriaceae bacterium]|nr:MAG: hypothetical protein KatS3mg032_0409 [Cyclobacteriaceae bacterium]
MRNLISVFCILVLFPAAGQKIKYKDIYSLLSTKQYEAAEPFLKKYLSETTDNPNAWLFMGIVYENKAGKTDILKSTEEALVFMDSAILTFTRAASLLTEKEIKRNAEYYAMYSRTDLRTGDYGVKLSDVQFDLRKRIEALRERMDKTKMVKHFFLRSEAAYTRSYQLYRSLQQSYPGLRELYLRADNQLLEKLTHLALSYDSAAKDFDNYRLSIQNLDKPGYKPVWNPRVIKNFKTDGAEPADFYTNEPAVWDYGRFAREAQKSIQEQVMPVRQELVTYDIEINKLAEKLQRDSVSVKSELTRLVQSLLSEKLRQFDERPMPLDILAAKAADLDYRSARIETRKHRDSAHVYFQVELIKRELQALNRLDSLLKIAASRNLDEEGLNYQDFVSQTYNSITLLKSYVRTQQEYVKKERERVEREMLRRTAALTWLINGNDSIPLFDNPSSPFKPLVLDPAFTAGLWYDAQGKPHVYFYDIPPSHRPGIRARFAVDGSVFASTELQALNMLVTSDNSSQIFFVLAYSTKPVKDKYAVVLAKIYRLDGLAWQVSHNLDFVPQSIVYQAETNEVIIRSGGELSVTIDKSGKRKAN